MASMPRWVSAKAAPAASDGELEEMAKVIPSATFQVYPDAGHIGIIQYPEGYANVIAAFLGHPLPR